jgi:hypothetical protein
MHNFDEEVKYNKKTSPKELLKIQKQLKEASDDEKLNWEYGKLIIRQ